MNTRRFFSWIVSGALLASATLASAQPAGDQKRVGELYGVAKKAFDSGRYSDAMRALDECYRLTNDPTYLWRTGYAAEKAYGANPNDADLKKAVESYRAYLAAAPTGPKRAVANQSLKKLEPLVPTAPAVDPANPAPPTVAPPAVQRTGVMITSSTPGAVIELDRRLRANGFLVADVESGVHKVRVVAEGFVTIERDVPVQPGALVGIDIPLDPVPALLAIRGPGGADLYVDGEPRGELPLARPITVAPGDHLIAVQHEGAYPIAMWQRVERDRTYDVHADLETTEQRYAAGITLGFAGGAAVAAAVLTGLTVAKENEAQDILSPVTDKTGAVPDTSVTAYDAAIVARDELRIGAGVAWGLTGAALTTGIILFIFDKPTLQTPPAPSGKPDAPLLPGELENVEISAAPMVDPGLAGVLITGRF